MLGIYWFFSRLQLEASFSLIQKKNQVLRTWFSFVVIEGCLRNHNGVALQTKLSSLRSPFFTQYFD